MSTYFPPKKGVDAGPQVGQPPASERRDGADPASAAAQSVLDVTAASINAWVAAQRQNVANSSADYHRARFDHPLVEVDYQNHAGQERITTTPKPVAASSSSQPDDRPQPPNDLPELARTDQANPETPLYLMVLYGTDQIAAVPMDNLADPSAFYVGQCDKTVWSTAGGPLPTLQAKLGGTEFVMLPLDITGTVAVTTLWLMTNALGDAVATDAPLTDTPLFNGTAKALYTIGGAYSYAQGKLAQTTSFDGTLAPTAIGPDGTCIYQPQVAGSCSVQVDLASSALNAAISAAIAATAPDLPSISVYGCACMENSIQRTETQGPSGATHDTEVISLSATVDIITTAPYQQHASLSGYSCWGSASFGQQPVVQNFRYSIEGASALSFDGTAFQIATLDTGDASTDISNTLPMTNYTTSGGLDILDVPVTASQARSETMMFDTSKTPGVYALSGSNSFTYSGTNGEAPGSADFVYYTQEQTCSGVLSTVDLPSTPYTQAEVDSYYKAGVAALMSLDGISDQSHAVPVVSLTSTFFAPPTVSAPLSAIPAGQPEGNYQGISGGYGAADGSYETYAGYASLGLPVTYPTIDTETIKATAFVLGQPLEWDYSTGGSKDNQPSLTLFHFPPLLDGKGFMALSTEQSTTIITPYDTYQNSAQADFMPWLHVSNGSHCIQGYAVDGALHAYLDGGTKDWLPSLATVLKCEVAEIVTMVMDVTLDKIKAVAHVKGQRYAASTSGSSDQV